MEIANITNLISILIISLVLASIFTFSLFFMSKKVSKKEEENVLKELDVFIKQIEGNRGDFLKSYEHYIAELKEYSIINKRLAFKSLRMSLLISFFGFVLIISGIIVSNYIIESTVLVIISTVAGILLQGVTAFIYRGYLFSARQMNYYLSKLNFSHKLYSAVLMADNMPADKKETFYYSIAQSILAN